jgi:hypothetical protein
MRSDVASTWIDVLCVAAIKKVILIGAFTVVYLLHSALFCVKADISFYDILVKPPSFLSFPVSSSFPGIVT